MPTSATPALAPQRGRLSAAALCAPVTPLHDVGGRVSIAFTARVGESRQIGRATVYDVWLATPTGLLLVRDVPAFRLSAMEGV